MGNGKKSGKAEQAAQTRAEFQRRKRQRAWRTRAVIALVGLAVAGSAGYCVLRERELTSAIVDARYPAGEHVAGTVAYRENPPLGGAHNVLWQNCGIYNVPIHNEHAVHSLEHGAVWITYRPDLPAADVERLQKIATDDYMLLSPYPGLPAPVVVSAWNHQLALTGAGDGRLGQFIARFKNNPSTTPEFGAPCAGGTSNPASVDSLQAPPTTGPMR
jgi:hypothetical protein